MNKSTSSTDAWQKFMAGFDLGGWRQADGKVRSFCNEIIIMDDWPEAIAWFGNTYTLERVEKGAQQNGETWENAIYV